MVEIECHSKEGKMIMELLDQSLIVIETGHYYRRPAAQLDQLPPVPGKNASPEAWREYHQALYEAGLLDPSREGGIVRDTAERIFGEKLRLPEVQESR